MNTQEAKKAKSFASIARREPDGATIVKVPGHNGRFYYVKVTERTVTCRFTGRRKTRMSCPSVGSGTICYHALAAYELVHGDVHWCESEADAVRLENLGKHRVEVRSAQDSSAVAWAVIAGKGESEGDRDARLLEMSNEYLALMKKIDDKVGLTTSEQTRIAELRTQFGILKWSHSTIVNFVREKTTETIKKAQSALGTDTDYASMI